MTDIAKSTAEMKLISNSLPNVDNFEAKIFQDGSSQSRCKSRDVKREGIGYLSTSSVRSQLVTTAPDKPMISGGRIDSVPSKVVKALDVAANSELGGEDDMSSVAKVKMKPKDEAIITTYIVMLYPTNNLSITSPPCLTTKKPWWHPVLIVSANTEVACYISR